MSTPMLQYFRVDFITTSTIEVVLDLTKTGAYKCLASFGDSFVIESDVAQVTLAGI